jgi:membrane-associated protein
MGTNRVPELLHDFVRLFTDTKDVLGELFTALGPWSYAVLFAIVFAETGLVVMPLLPGDSLLFATGALAGMGHLDVRLAAILIFCAALLGDNVNYRIGRAIGPRAFSGRYRWLKKEHLEKTRVFFERHGAKAVILARFAPIVRTFAPFVAGVGAMPYWKFLTSSLIGAFIWVGGFMGAGYYCGSWPFVEKHFTKIVLAIVVLSMIPAILGWLSTRKDARNNTTPKN